MIQEPESMGCAKRVSPGAENQVRVRGLQVRLARTPCDSDAVQRLRNRPFSEEECTVTETASRCPREHNDAFDEVADHLMVVDPAGDDGMQKLVGACRLIRGRNARRPGAYLPAPGFPTGVDFDIENLLQWPGEALEVGCVRVDDAIYGSRSIIDMLWQGVAAYTHAFNIGLVFGCAGFPGIDPRRVAEPLSLLYYKRLAPLNLRPRASEQRHVPMNLVPGHLIRQRTAIASMPPLVKSYLRLGAFFGDGAVVDRDRSVVKVCAVIPAAALTERRYGRYRDRLFE